MELEFMKLDIYYDEDEIFIMNRVLIIIMIKHYIIPLCLSCKYYQLLIVIVVIVVVEVIIVTINTIVVVMVMGWSCECTSVTRCSNQNRIDFLVLLVGS